MLQRLGRMRSGWAVAAVGALVASLLAVGTTTATAVTDTPDERSRVNVCVGEALEDRNFSDVPDDHIFHDAINCLAHYGVTIGSGDGTTFTPNEPVQRWQMMLFLTRALVPTGINLTSARDQGFTDIASMGAEARDAINLLATNGIARATPGRPFEPYAIVDRAEMAGLLVRLLDKAGSVVTFASNGDILLDANGDRIQTEPDDYFDDARDQVPRATDQAISAAYELGITTGADPTPAVGDAQPGLDFFYRPRGSVTRGQMAAFIIRTLGHTMARPKGISAWYDGEEIQVSLRDDNFRPIDDAPIDAFFIETEDVERAFTSRGDCDRDVRSVEDQADSIVCGIDDSDRTTDDEGELQLAAPDTVTDGDDTTVWIWTGNDRDDVDQDTELFRLDIKPAEQVRIAVRARVSADIRGSKARFGTTVTITVQLEDAHGNAVRFGKDGERPAEWEVTERELEETTVDGDIDDAGESTASIKRLFPARTETSDSSGKRTFTLRVPDPNRSTENSRTRTIHLVAGTNAPDVFVADSKLNPILESGSVPKPGEYFLEFSDAAPDLAQSVVTVTTTNRYLNVARDRIHNIAEVSAYDEYGEPLSAATFMLSSDKTTDLDATQSRSFPRSGMRRVSYFYEGRGYEVEELTATVDPDGSSGDAAALTATAHMFWPAITGQTDSVGQSSDAAAFTILFGDLNRGEIIVDINNTTGPGWPEGVVPHTVSYDDRDFFNVPRSGTTPQAVGSIEAFERVLATYLAVSPNSERGTGACLHWERLGRGSRAEISLWRLAENQLCDAINPGG